MSLDFSQEAKFASPRYFLPTYSCIFLTPRGLSAKRIPDAAATQGFSSRGGIFCHQSEASKRSCSKLTKKSDVTFFNAVFAPSLIPWPLFWIMDQPKEEAIIGVPSLLASSTIIFLTTNLIPLNYKLNKYILKVFLQQSKIKRSFGIYFLLV